MLLSQAEIGLIEHVQNIKELKHTILSYPNLFNTNHKECRRCDLHDVLIITNATPTNIKFIRIDICSKCKYINFEHIVEAHVVLSNNNNYRGHCANPFMTKQARELIKQAINYDYYKLIIDELLSTYDKLYYDNALYG